MTDQLPPEQPRQGEQKTSSVPEQPTSAPIGVQEGEMANVAKQAINNENPDEGLRQIVGEEPSNSETQESQPTTDPRQQIEDLNDSLRAHFRGQWEDDAPQDPAERQRVLEKEFANYEEMTGFSRENKRHLENLQQQWAKASGYKTKGATAQWDITHREQEVDRRNLRRMEREAVEKRLTAASSPTTSSTLK